MATGQEKGCESATIVEMAKAISSAMPKLDETEQRIAIGTYRLLVDGEPVTSEAIAQATNNTVGRVEEALSSWPGVYRDDEGRVVGFWGLATAALDPEYRFLIDGKTSYAWCALDTLFIPALLGKTVGVEAADPVTGERVSLVVDQNGVHDLKPSGAVVSMVIPDGPFDYDVIASFCHKVLFFASEEAGASWTAKHKGTTLLSVQDAFELGRGFERVYPDVFGLRN
ncbi:MAG TPA: organomercurial lyase [Candidatus Dormibacteraeota bacterium]|nr:organomercurial lyase [Candidatus Dormibacteraeota bacterium]